MKKLLFGVMALSALSFGANPGDTVPTTQNGTGSASVPMEVRVTVLPKGSNLILVDQNNILINKLIFEHGSMIAGLSAESKVEKEVRLMRADGKPFSNTDTNNGDAGTNTYKAKFEAKDLNGASIDGTGTNNFKLVRQTGTNAEIESTFTFRTSDINVSATDKMVMTKVISTIPQLGSTQDSGLYVGSGEFKATLTMN